MYFRLKRAFLHLSKWLGLFRLARRVTRRGLRIIMYHGGSLLDEYRFRPATFMTSETFRRRIDHLVRCGYPIMKLDDALDRLDDGTLPPRTTVITIDDGFYSTCMCMLDALKERSIPATIYMTTYYCERATPIFDLIVPYVLWKSEQPESDLSSLNVPGIGRIELADSKQRDDAARRIIDHGHAQCTEPERVELARALGEAIGVDYAEVADRRLFSLMTPDEIRDAAKSGIDIQLHTHRHAFPQDEKLAAEEIADNRAALEDVTNTPLRHFCYPSGEWSTTHWPSLQAAGIRSASTCEQGLNYPETPRLALKRLGDGEHVSQIEFEAQLSGYMEAFRWLRSAFSSTKDD